MDDHGLATALAVERARQTFAEIARGQAIKQGQGHAATPDTGKELTPMGRPADPTKPCGHCHRPKTDHAPTCPRAGHKKRKPVTRTRGRRGRRAANNGADPVAQIRAILDALDRELAGARTMRQAFERAFGVSLARGGRR
jgi:hypothetical protein